MLKPFSITILSNIRVWCAILTISVFTSCNQIGKSAEDAIKKRIEKSIEEKTGTKVDFGNIDKYEDNKAFVSFKAADKVYLKNDEKLKGSVVIQKENDELSISFQLSDENGKALVTIVNHIPKNFSLPIIGKFAVSNHYDGVNPVATFMFMQAREDIITSPTPFEGTLKILKLSAKEITFEMEGNGGEPIDAESPSAWKPMSAKGVITSPIIQTFGIDKKDVLR